MSKTRIEWCDETWNPVWGCMNNCPYCYARTIAKRFGSTENEKLFIPEWRESGFNKKFARKTKRVFVNSMSDIMYWEKYWMDKVIGEIKKHQYIDFIFLTKGGFQAYAPYTFPDNVICGVTATTPHDVPPLLDSRNTICKRWLLNIEPLLAPFTSTDSYSGIDFAQYANSFDWIIVGALTGKNHRGITPVNGIYSISSILSRAKCPVFLKPSITCPSNYPDRPDPIKKSKEYKENDFFEFYWRREEFIGDVARPCPGILG